MENKDMDERTISLIMFAFLTEKLFERGHQYLEHSEFTSIGNPSEFISKWSDGYFRVSLTVEKICDVDDPDIASKLSPIMDEFEAQKNEDNIELLRNLSDGIDDNL